MASTGRHPTVIDVPCGTIERAGTRDMIYAACPRCLASVATALQHRPVNPSLGVTCPRCGIVSTLEGVVYRYRLKLQIIAGDEVRDAILFDEAAESLLGAPAVQLHKLLGQHPALAELLEQLLVGLHVAFAYQPAENRLQSPHKYNRDMKIVRIRPLVSALLPKAPVTRAMDYLTMEHLQTRGLPT